VVAAAMLGALLGFLWWNAPPAQIFMGDVGSQAIGGLLAAMAILTNTHMLLGVLGAIYVAETLSVIIQVVSFRTTGNRVFRMTPIHYHFDLAGWPETTVVIRFWILTGIGVALGLGLFYADFLAVEGILEGDCWSWVLPSPELPRPVWVGAWGTPSRCSTASPGLELI
jgi:phospho-N-acetylmuramoyl-pentapeptide-transferase